MALLPALQTKPMAGARACRRFQCNVCGMLTEVPLEYYCAVDGNGVRHDIDQRPELSQGSVEYIAPQEYMVRRASWLSWLHSTVEVPEKGLRGSSSNACLHVGVSAVPGLRECRSLTLGKLRSRLSESRHGYPLHQTSSRRSQAKCHADTGKVPV